MRLLNQKILNLFKDCKASIAIEFAFLLPVLLMVAFPVIDYSRYILLQQKLIKTSSTIADSIAMSVPLNSENATNQQFEFSNAVLTEDLIRQFSELAAPLLSPYGTRNNFAVTISNIDVDAAGTPTQAWRYERPAGKNATGNFDDSTQEIPNNDNVPDELINSLEADDNLVRAEVSVRFEPFTPNFLNFEPLEDRTVSSVHYYRSRYGNLSRPTQSNGAQFGCDPADYIDCSAGDQFTGFRCFLVPLNCPCPVVDGIPFYQFAIQPPALQECRHFNLCQANEFYLNNTCVPRAICNPDEFLNDRNVCQAKVPIPCQGCACTGTCPTIPCTGEDCIIFE